MRVPRLVDWLFTCVGCPWRDRWCFHAERRQSAGCPRWARSHKRTLCCPSSLLASQGTNPTLKVRRRQEAQHLLGLPCLNKDVWCVAVNIPLIWNDLHKVHTISESTAMPILTSERSISVSVPISVSLSFSASVSVSLSVPIPVSASVSLSVPFPLSVSLPV